MHSCFTRSILILLFLLAGASRASANYAQGERGIVASVQPTATQAGIDAMKNGGNAVDAAVAVALTLGVVDGHDSGIGGGCFMLIRRASYEIICFPPPSSGGVHVAEILNVLENFDLKAMAAPGQREHVIAEAMKLAFADRAFWLGDPDFAKVPRGLVDKGYAKELSRRINLAHTTAVPTHGTPPDAESRLFGKHTTHFSTADAEGNWVACTATINTPFGSKVIVPGTGIFLNDEMDDFSAQPGVPNAFKLVGAEANAVAPGKRPLSSMSPTIVLKDKQPVMALGAAGGPTIISQTVLNLVGVLDLGLRLDETIARPRIHQQWRPDQLRIEKALPADVRAALKARGHEFFEERDFGVSQAIGRGPDGEGFVGASDPRAGGSAAGW